MAGIRACVNGHGLSGEAAKKAEDLLRLYDEIAGQERLALFGDELAADRAARLKAAAIITDARARGRMRDRLQAARQFAFLETAGRHEKGIGNGIQAGLGFDIHHVQNNIANIETTAAVIGSEANRIKADFIEAVRARGLNLKRNLEQTDDILDGLYAAMRGETVEGELGAIIGGFTASNRYEVAEFRRAGGHLPERQGWFPNPLHDTLKVRFAGGDAPSVFRKLISKAARRGTAADRRAWVDFVKPLLDRERMIDFETGAVLNDVQLAALLADVWDTLSSGGLNKIEPGSPGGRSVANRRADPRVLFYKSADAWREYNARFGEGDIVQSIVRQTETMARDIALMRVLGPNPNHTMRVALDVARQEGIGGIKRRHIEHQYRIASGQVGTTSETFARVAQDTRNLLVANQLGSAALTALGDMGFTKLTTEFNGIGVGQVFKFYAQQFADREIGANMTRQGIILDNLLGSSAAAHRFMDGLSRGGATGKIADVVLRASLLTQMTDNMRRAFAQAVHGELWDKLRAAPSFEKLAATDRPFFDMLTRYGVTAEDWTVMGRAQGLEFRGQTFFEPSRLMELADIPFSRAQALSERLRGMIIQEQNFAVPTSNSRVDALLGGGLDRGSVTGEMARFFALYKRFPMLIMHTHAMRAISAPSKTPLGKWGYAARLVIYTGMMGAVSLQLAELAAGRTPIDPTVKPREFMLRAMLKGGALGIWGDVLLSDVSGYGRSIGATLAGPAWGLVNDTARLTLGTAQSLGAAAFTGELETNFSRELVRYFDRYLSPGSKLWYLRGAWDRLVRDQLLELADPGYAQKRRRRLTKAAGERGQGYFFGPGGL